MRRIIGVMTTLVVSFVLVACGDGINHKVLDSKKSILAVISEKDENVPGTENGMGTGFFIDKNVIVTNKHVVEKAAKIKVALESSPDFYEAEIVDTDPVADIAVIRIVDWNKFEDENEYGLLEFAGPKDLTVTQPVYVVGHPWGLVWSVSKGILSAVDRKFTASPKILIQTDAHVYNGNSGGPMLNEDGKVLGINSIMLAKDGGSYGFAAPVILIEKVLRDFERYDGSVHWAFLGISLDNDKIQEVSAGSAAEAGGLKAGDVIMAFTTSDGTYSPVEKSISVAMATHDPEKPVNIVVKRGDQELILNVMPAWKDSETIMRETAEAEQTPP